MKSRHRHQLSVGVASAPTERQGGVGQNRFNDTRIVVGTELPWINKQEHAGLGDSLVGLQYFDMCVPLAT